MRLPITALISLAAFLLCTLGSTDAAMADSSSLRSAQSESLIAYVCIQDKSQPTQNQRQLWECHGWDFVSGVRVNWYSYVGGNPVNRTDPTGYYTFESYNNVDPTEHYQVAEYIPKFVHGQPRAIAKLKPFLAKHDCSGSKVHPDTLKRLKAVLAYLES